MNLWTLIETKAGSFLIEQKVNEFNENLSLVFLEINIKGSLLYWTNSNRSFDW